MMRILLATGEEAVYRTVDELALGISSGMVTATARVFDTPSQDWRAIETHPQYQQALARAALLVHAAALDPKPPNATAPLPERADPAGNGQPIYQMFSLSAAELQAKRRPRWLLPGLAGIAAVIMVISVMSLIRSREEPKPDRAEVPTSTTLPGRLPPSPTASGPISSVEAMRLAPVNLNFHQVFAMEAAGRRLNDSAIALGMTGLLHPARLTSPDKIRVTRNHLGLLRDVIGAYRTNQRRIVGAYRDTAAMLIRTGFWSKIDQQEWKVFPSPMEPAGDAVRADSLLETLERLYVLLSDQNASYRTFTGKLAFRDSVKGAEYQQIRSELSRFETTPDSTASTFGPLSLLRGAISQPTGAPTRASSP